jgi:hypothetical protein
MILIMFVIVQINDLLKNGKYDKTKKKKTQLIKPSWNSLFEE